jgi:Uma2 family endonuclease
MALEELLALPEAGPALEYDEEVVRQRAAPQGQRVTLQDEFTQRVNAVARPRKLARAYPELRTTYAGRSRVPDVSVYLWHRIPRLPNGRVANRFTEPPDIAVEIVSPGQSVTDLVSTCVWYVKNGVRIALIADPDEDTVLRFRPDALPDVLTGGRSDRPRRGATGLRADGESALREPGAGVTCWPEGGGGLH